MLRPEKASIKNVGAILKLSVSEAQKNFVASNNDSIIEAIRPSRPTAMHSRPAFMKEKRRSVLP